MRERVSRLVVRCQQVTCGRVESVQFPASAFHFTVQHVEHILYSRSADIPWTLDTSPSEDHLIREANPLADVLVIFTSDGVGSAEGLFWVSTTYCEQVARPQRAVSPSCRELEALLPRSMVSLRLPLLSAGVEHEEQAGFVSIMSCRRLQEVPIIPSLADSTLYKV